MKFVCVDTSTSFESIALVEDDHTLGEHTICRGRGHASGLHEDLRALLSDVGWTLKELDGFVCGLGPGSFTGMRVGLATCKGLAYALQKDIYGVPTPLALLAITQSERALSLIDARRGEVYAQGFGLQTPQCLTPQAMITFFQESNQRPDIIIGDGAVKHRSLLKEAWPSVIIPKATAYHLPRAALLVHDQMLTSNLETLEPIYVRRSDAEINYPDGFPNESRLFQTQSNTDQPKS